MALLCPFLFVLGLDILDYLKKIWNNNCSCIVMLKLQGYNVQIFKHFVFTFNIGFL